MQGSDCSTLDEEKESQVGLSINCVNGSWCPSVLVRRGADCIGRYGDRKAPGTMFRICLAIVG
jgi:hypothetical protein